MDVTSNQITNHHFTERTVIKDDSVSKSFLDMYNHDFPERKPEKLALSNEDLQFISLMQNNISKNGDHYQLPLPFKNSDLVMNDNRKQAQYRLLSVKRKMQRDCKFHEEYSNFITKLLDKKYAIKSDHAPLNRTWYLPHFGVRH